MHCGLNAKFTPDGRRRLMRNLTIDRFFFLVTTAYARASLARSLACLRFPRRTRRLQFFVCVQTS